MPTKAQLDIMIRQNKVEKMRNLRIWLEDYFDMYLSNEMSATTFWGWVQHFMDEFDIEWYRNPKLHAYYSEANRHLFYSLCSEIFNVVGAAELGLREIE